MSNIESLLTQILSELKQIKEILTFPQATIEILQYNPNWPDDWKVVDVGKHTKDEDREEIEWPDSDPDEKDD